MFIFSGLVISSYIFIILFFNFGLPVKDSIAKSNIAASSIKTISNTSKKAVDLSLKIPSLRINTVLEQVGLTKQGAVDAPKDILKAAWFNLSVRPGVKGVAIIVGHFGSKNGVSSIFTNLSRLKIGDQISTNDASGLVTNFVVTKIEKYDQNLEVPAIFIASDNKAHLNLITCNGNWNKITKSYPQRLVIFTDKK